MHIVIAPDSFKESMTAKQAARSIERGVHKLDPSITTTLIPLADGGEGTVQSLVDVTRGEFIFVTVHDPLMRPIMARYGILGDGHTAILEMAAASGLELLNENEKNPMFTTSYGTGELIKDALDRACKRIIIGIGGSATNEGGAGMISALGGHLLNKEGQLVSPHGSGIGNLSKLDLSQLDERLKHTEFIVASDVQNPLLGENGATEVFGQQKGATAEMLNLLEVNLINFVNILEETSGRNVRDIPGSGAAGGLGAAMLAVLESKIQPGFKLVADFTQLEDHIQKADLVITGEGTIDKQTQFGKTPYGVAQIALKYNIPTIAYTGILEEGDTNTYQKLFKCIFTITPKGIPLSQALKKAPEYIEKSVANTLSQFL